MKWVKSLVLVLVLAIPSYSYADTPTSEPDGYDAIVDAMFLRPFGLLGMCVGTGLFIALSPMTAIASIPAPHNAFVELADVLIVNPTKYTFVRPFGDY